MRIIHVVLGKANPDRMNGINKVVHSLASHQHLIGADVEVWGITSSPLEVPSDRLYKIKLFKADFSKWKIDDHLEKALKEAPEKTVFHLHGGFIPQFYWLARRLRKERRAYILTPHGNYMKGAMRKNRFLKTCYFRMFEKSILIHSLFVHCIGAGEVTDIKKIYSGNNVKLIPNGQDFNAFEFQYKKIATPGQPIFGFCGRITMYQKGLDLLLEGFKLYKQSAKGTGVLWFIGDGEYKGQLIKFSKENNLQESILLYGAKFGEEKLNLMANMDAFYHPSRSEGLPMAVLEASVLGKPLVVSQYTNMTEYVLAYNAGICLQENTPKAIAESMHEITTGMYSGKLGRWGQNARRMAEENFDWKVIAQKLLNEYASAIIPAYV